MSMLADLLQRRHDVERQAGGRRPVQLAGLLARELHEAFERIRPSSVLGHGQRQGRVDRARHRHDVAHVVGQLVAVDQRIDRDQSGEAEDQRMVVAVGQERLHRQDAVGALAVLHHHRLAPFLRQPLGKHPRHHVHAAAGPERRDHADGVLRPVRRRLGVRCAGWPRSTRGRRAGRGSRKTSGAWKHPVPRRRAEASSRRHRGRLPRGRRIAARGNRQAQVLRAASCLHRRCGRCRGAAAPAPPCRRSRRGRR